MIFTEINPNFAIKSNVSEQKYPALQVTNYRPRTEDEQINFCFSETSHNLLFEENTFFETEIVECIYGKDKVLMHQIKSSVRWIFLNIPRIFIQDKNTEEVSLPERGVKLFGTDKVTIAKCFLACLVGDELVLDINGLLQIFTLKLTSSKTQLIGYQDNTENQTILSLNSEIQKHFKTKDNLVHLVSVNLEANVKQFVSTHSGKSSFGVNFELVGNARVLNSLHQQQIFNLVSSDEAIAIFDDPFGLKLKDDLNSLNNLPEYFAADF